jgi:hypothetical protein
MESAEPPIALAALTGEEVVDEICWNKIIYGTKGKFSGGEVSTAA